MGENTNDDQIRHTAAELKELRAKAKKAKEFGDAILRLEKNKDFQKVITEAFMRDEAARMVQMSVEWGLSAEDRADSLGMAQASGYLRSWLSARLRIANQAAVDVRGYDEELDEQGQD